MIQDLSSGPSRTYNAILRKAFSQDVGKDGRLVERNLVDELGVSRTPIREALRKLVAQGILVGGKKGQGVFVRRYSAEDVRQLYEYREILEAGAAVAAVRSARESDLLRMSMICDEMQTESPHFESPRWLDLDRKFHEALAAAGHNQRIIHAMEATLTECFFMFYAPSEWPDEQIAESKQRIAKRVVIEHQAIIEKLRCRDEPGAEKLAREHVCWFGDLASKVNIAAELKREPLEAWL